MLRSRLPLSRVLMSCSCVPILCPDLDPLSWGALLLGEGKARVTEEEKEKNEREKKAFRVVGSFSSMRARRSCRCQQGWLHVVALFITGAMRRRHLPIMAFHSVLADVVVN